MPQRRSVPVVSVRLTQTVLNALESLKHVSETCPDAKTKRRLVKIQGVLQGALSDQQRGGMAALSPAILNVSGGFIDNSREVMDAGQAGHGLLNIPAPFSDSAMGLGAVFTETTTPLYVPSTLPAVPAPAAPAVPAQAGGKKSNKKKPVKH